MHKRIAVCSSGGYLQALLNSGSALAGVCLYYLFPFALRFQDELYRVAESPISAGVGSDVVRLFFYLGAGVFDGYGQASGAHSGKIDDVVADEGGFFQFDSRLPDDLFESGLLVLNSLTDIFKLQVSGAKGNSFRDALGNESRLDAGHASERNGCAVVGMEAFGFDEGLAAEAEAEAALAAMLSRLFEDALFCACRRGEDEKLAIGEDAVDVEEEEFNFAGAGVSGKFGHRMEF